MLDEAHKGRKRQASQRTFPRAGLLMCALWVLGEATQPPGWDFSFAYQ